MAKVGDVVIRIEPKAVTIVACMIEAMAMQAANDQRRFSEFAPAYDEEAFEALLNRMKQAEEEGEDSP